MRSDLRSQRGQKSAILRKHLFSLAESKMQQEQEQEQGARARCPVLLLLPALALARSRANAALNGCKGGERARPRLRWRWLLLLLLVYRGDCQILPVRARPAGAPTGSQFVAIIAPMSLTERENWIYAQVVSGNIPDFLRTLIPITVHGTINGTNHTCSY